MRFEALEDRTTPAVYTPTTTTDFAIASDTDVTPTTGLITVGPGAGNVTLRSAVMAARLNAGADTINLSAGGIYTLSVAGNDNLSLAGDLDIYGSLTITGNGQATTIIQGATNAAFANSIGDKVFAINPLGTSDSLTVSISNLTIRFGRNIIANNDPFFAYTGGGVDVFLTGPNNNISFTNVTITGNENVNSYGGGVNVDSANFGSGSPEGQVTFTGCTISNNKALATGGGMNLFADNHNVIIDNCTIQNNTTTGLGGAGAQGGGINIRHTNGGTVTIRNNTVITGNSAADLGGGIDIQSLGKQTVVIQDTRITNNSSTKDGGGLALDTDSSGTSVTLTRATITGNTANSDNSGGGDGGAISRTNTAPLTVNFSRISGNIANTGGGGTGTKGIRNTATGTVDATNNWWGADANPGNAGTDGTSTSSGTITSIPRLDLVLTPVPSSISKLANSTLTADFTKNSAGTTVTIANLAAVIGLPIAFGGTLGNISGAQPTIQANGIATATYTAGSVSGVATVTAQVDNAPAASNTITIINVAPVLSAIEGTALTYTENDPATSISSTIQVADSDNANLASATVAITANYVNGQDILSFTNQLGITGNFVPGTGVMTLTGPAAVSDFQTALRAVKYQNTSTSPSTAPRTVTFQVNDGAGSNNLSNAPSRIVNVVNLVPTVISVGPVVPNPRNTNVSTVNVVLSEPINLATFDFNDLTLTRNLGGVALNNTVTVTLVSGSTYRVNNLTGFTGTDGDYVLTVNMSGVQEANGAAGTGSGAASWTMDTTGPAVTGVFFDGTTWAPAFRTAGGNSNFGFPAQTGANQFVSMPWSTTDTIYVQFNEPVGTVNLAQVGVRGINVPAYTVSSVTMFSTTVAKIVVAGGIDTDRVVVALDGSSAGAIADALGNKLMGTFADNGTLPSSGANGVDFKFRFIVAVGDADRNGQVRNADVNLVRANLFVDAGQAGYNIFADIDGNGLTRNADVNTVRSHLFVDPPAGPGPNRPGRGGGAGSGNLHTVQTGGRFDSERAVNPERDLRVLRRSTGTLVVNAIDALFELG